MQEGIKKSHATQKKMRVEDIKTVDRRGTECKGDAADRMGELCIQRAANAEEDVEERH